MQNPNDLMNCCENNLKTMPSTTSKVIPDIGNKITDSSSDNFQVYKRRYWMLFLLSFLSLLSGMLCTQYIAMANVMGCYYGVSQDAILWTILIVMVVYVIFVFPASYLINLIDLRWTVISGSFINTTACVLQIATIKRAAFPVVMVSALLASFSNILVVAVPPFLAAKWFPSNELSRACTFGIVGNQLGLAVGFIFSPLLVPSDCELTGDIEDGKLLVAICLTVINLVVLILIIVTFQNAPKFPPSLAQAKKEESSKSYIPIVLNLLRNKNFALVFVTYGLMVGTAFAFGTTLNARMLRYFPGTAVEIGWMGTLFTVVGLVSSILIGYVLDYTHKFKQISIGICITSLVTFCIHSLCLYVDKLWIQFITIGTFGFFVISSIPVGIQYGIEVTYPEPEVITASLLNASTNLFGIILTEITSHFLDDVGPISSNVALGVTLLIAGVITCFITTDYKRSTENSKL